MFDRGDSVFDLIHAYKSEEGGGSLMDKYSRESVFDNPHSTSPLDYHSGDGVHSVFASGPSYFSDNNPQNMFNVRASNYGNMSLIDKMRGIQANRLDLSGNEVSLAEGYADRSLDFRTMGGLYNATLTDVYSDRRRFEAMHGLLTDGLYSTPENAQMDLDSAIKNDSFSGTIIGNYKSVLDENKSNNNESIYYQQSNEPSNDNSKNNSIKMSSITSSFLNHHQEVDLVTMHNNTGFTSKLKGYEITSSIGSVTSFESAQDKETDLVKKHSHATAIAEQAVSNEEKAINSDIKKESLSVLALSETTSFQRRNHQETTPKDTQIKSSFDVSKALDSNDKLDISQRPKLGIYNELETEKRILQKNEERVSQKKESQPVKSINISSQIEKQEINPNIASAEKTSLLNTKTSKTEETYHGEYDSEKMRPWHKQKHMVVNIASAIDSTEDMVPLKKESIQDNLLAQEEDIKRKTIKVINKSDSEEKAPERNYAVEEKTLELKTSMFKNDFNGNLTKRFKEEEYYDEKEIEKKKTELEQKMIPILSEMHPEEIKKLIISLGEKKLAINSFEEGLILDLKIKIAKKYLDS